MNTFIDLLQTQSIIVPVFFVLLVCTGFGVIIYLTVRRPDANDLSLARQEVARRNRQEAKLTHFYETGEVEPKERMLNLSRGSEALETPWFRDLLTKYQFALETGDGGTVALRDTKYEGLDNNLVVVDMGQMMSASYIQWEVKVRMSRSNVRRRAISQGLEVKYDRPGNPGKQIGGDVA